LIYEFISLLLLCYDDVNNLIIVSSYRVKYIIMSMDRPNKPYPGAPTTSPLSTPSSMPLYIHDPSIKGVSFDQLLSQRGIRMIHKKAIPCMNIESTSYQGHQPDCEFCDDSGIIYYDEKEIWGVFTGNSIEKTFEAHGVWEIGTAVVTLPTEYPDGEQADFNTYDKFLLPDFTVRLWELKEYEPTEDSVQKLRYDVTKVEYASSITDGIQKFYKVNEDFTISPEGFIQWVSGKEPQYDYANQRGEVIGWAYFAQPVYIVLQCLRELRITQELVNGVKQAKRLPQQVLVRRDFMADNAEKISNIST